MKSPFEAILLTQKLPQKIFDFNDSYGLNLGIELSDNTSCIVYSNTRIKSVVKKFFYLLNFNWDTFVSQLWITVHLGIFV